MPLFEKIQNEDVKLRLAKFNSGVVMTIVHVCVLHEHVLVDTLTLGVVAVGLLFSDILEGVYAAVAVSLVDSVDLSIDSSAFPGDERIVLVVIFVFKIDIMMEVKLLEVAGKDGLVIKIFGISSKVVGAEELVIQGLFCGEADRGIDF